MPGAERKAKTRILRALENGDKKLSLAGLGLTTLPLELCSLTFLERLDLSGNALSALPEHIGMLESLVELDLSSNHLSELPEEFSNLRALKKINLGQNLFSQFPLALVRMPGLEVLEVGGNQLKSLPAEIERLESLRILRVGCNSLRALPRELLLIASSLETLCLEGNEELPKKVREASEPAMALGYYFNVRRKIAPMKYSMPTSLYRDAGSPDHICICCEADVEEVVRQQLEQGYRVEIQQKSNGAVRVDCYEQGLRVAPRILDDLELDVNLIKPCGGYEGCCHYGEGCALGYPIYAALNGFGEPGFPPSAEEKRIELKMLYSEEFKNSWEGVLPKDARQERFLPCAHRGCSFNDCKHISEQTTMLRTLKKS